jgi:C4-dicarboxylate-specific signal transduction histidine kinase
MSKGNSVCEGNTCATLDEISQALHDLCQPLTTLQCRLEFAELLGTMDGYREAAAAGLVQCSRLVETVGSMREVLRAARMAGEVASRASA